MADQSLKKDNPSFIKTRTDYFWIIDLFAYTLTGTCSSLAFHRVRKGRRAGLPESCGKGVIYSKGTAGMGECGRPDPYRAYVYLEADDTAFEKRSFPWVWAGIISGSLSAE